MAPVSEYPKPQSDLRLRVLSALVLVPVALIVIWIGGVVFAACVAGISVIAAWELGRMLDKKAYGLRFWLAAIGSVVAIISLVLYGPVFGTVAGLAVISILAVGSLSGDLKIGVTPGTLAIPVIYVALPTLSLVALRLSEPGGLSAAALVFITVWATDIGAYFAGRRIGGPKLAPAISPGKTWSGAIGGLVAAFVAGIALAMVVGVSASFAGLVAVGLSVASQCGDLFESALKRRAGVKDSSQLIPGHGGVLDRVDGLLFASVAAFVIGSMHGGGARLAQGLLFW